MPRPTLFLLHALGLGARSWDGVVAALGDRVEPIALDLPGFGANAGSTALDVQETASWVAARIAQQQPDAWLIAGHSMGGKIATIVAAWSESGEHGLTPAAGLALVDPSPLAAEPMSEERRAAMLGWSADGPIGAADARAFVDANTGGAQGRLVDDAIEDVRVSSPLAWKAWLTRGSLEDWSEGIGVLRTPATLIASGEAGDLGLETQRRLTLPHLADAAVQEVSRARHFVVLERPEEVAAGIADLLDRVADRPSLPAAFARLIASDRVSARTRRVMLARLGEPPAEPRALTAAQKDLLTAVLARVLPQRGTDLDLAGRIDAELAAGHGDGWRFAELPPDAEAWRLGLDTIATAAPGFADLAPEEQDALLDRVAAGDVDGALTGAQAALWFQDVQAEAVRVWLSHPAAQAWIRYDGFADGGDGPRKQGFLTTHASEREAWQRDWRTGKELEA